MAKNKFEANKETVLELTIDTEQAIENLDALYKKLGAFPNLPSSTVNKVKKDLEAVQQSSVDLAEKMNALLNDNKSKVSSKALQKLQSQHEQITKAIEKQIAAVKKLEIEQAKQAKQEKQAKKPKKAKKEKTDSAAKQQEKLPFIPSGSRGQKRKTLSPMEEQLKAVTEQYRDLNAQIRIFNQLLKAQKYAADEAFQAFVKTGIVPAITEEEKAQKKILKAITAFNTKKRIIKYQGNEQFQEYQKSGQIVDVTPEPPAEEQASKLEIVTKALDGVSKGLKSLKTQSATANAAIDMFSDGLTAIAGLARVASGDISALGTTIVSAFKTSLGKLNLVIGLFKDLKKLTSRWSKNTKSDMEKAARAVTSFVQILASGFAGTAVGKYVNSMVEMAEAENLFTTAMKENVVEGRKFISLAKIHYGLDPVALQETVGLFYEMASAVDIPGKAASQLSKDMTALSLNVASLFNVDFEKVTENMQSGIRGMSRAVVKYGIDIRAATIEQFAASELGITQQFESMNEASRELLRYLVIVKQTTDANGDLAKTIEQPANQLRILKEQFIVLGRNLATVFLPMIQSIIPVINGVLMAVNMLVESFAKLFGLITVSDEFEAVENGINGVGSAAESAAKKAKDFLAPFDELHVLAENMPSSDSSGLGFGEVDPRILEALDKVQVNLDHIRMKAHEVRDAILEWLGLDYNPELDNATGEWAKYFDIIEGGFSDLILKAWKAGDYSTVGGLINEKIASALENFSSAEWWETQKNKVTDKLGPVIDIINGFFEKPATFEKTGAALALGLATALEIFDYTVQKFNWTNLGARLADTLAEFFTAENDDGQTWLEVGLIAFAHSLNGLTKAAVKFATNFPWVEVGTKLAESCNIFFSTWDAEQTGEAAHEVIDGLLDMMEHWVTNTNWDTVGVKLAQMLEAIKWGEIFSHLGTLIWEGIKAAITAAIAGKGVKWDNKSSFEKVLTGVFNPGEAVLGAMGSMLNDAEDAIRKTTDYTSSNGNTTGTVNDKYNTTSITTKDPDTGKVTTVTGTGTGGVNAGMGAGRTWMDEWDALDRMATGGVVTGPTSALIGEAGRSEAVIPLEGAPQMEDLINKIAAAVSSTPSGPTEVRVFIGDKEWDAFTYQSSERGKKIVGAQPIKVTSFS